MSTPTEVLIVGAGPVGLTMAAALTHQGLSCRIIDKAPAPSNKSKALAVWCRTMELLDGLGLAETFVRTGLKLKGGSMYANGKRVVHLELTSDESPFGFPLMIPQNETERILTEHLVQKNVIVDRQVELITFGEKPNAVACTLRHADGREESIDVSWLIGCDGAHSTVRHTLGMEFTGHAEPNDWMLADVHIEGTLAKDEVSIFWHDQGVLAFFPINRDRFRMIADIGAASAGPPPAEITLEQAQSKVDERGPGGLALSDPIWLANFRINERKVSDYRRGRVMLAGDAAHIHSPAGGQGMNTGMQDAFNLAWKLALIERGIGQAEPLLSSYSGERSAVGDQVLRNAERITNLSTLQSPVAKWLRNHVAPILSSLPVVKDKIRDDWFELSINYRQSLLTAEDWPVLGGGVPAGDRMPDGKLECVASGKPTSLFAEMDGTQHQLLLFPASNAPQSIADLTQLAGDVQKSYPDLFATHLFFKPGDKPTSPIPGEVQVWLDMDSRLDAKLSITHPTAIVVRPDGYIGYRGQPADGSKVMTHLKSYLLADGA